MTAVRNQANTGSSAGIGATNPSANSSASRNTVLQGLHGEVGGQPSGLDTTPAPAPIPPTNEPSIANAPLTSLSSQPSGTNNSNSQETPATDPFSVPKRKFSKVYLIVFIVVIVLGVLGYLLWKYLPSSFLDFGKEGEITWWGLWEDDSIIQPLIDEYQTQNPKIKITYVRQSPKDYRERLTNSLARGEGPDIFRFHNTWVPMFRNELDPVPPSIMSSEEFSRIYYPIILSDLTSGAGIMGIPLGYDAITLYINEDIFATAGKTPPETWDDFRQLAKDLTSKANNEIVQSGVALGITENVDHWPEILATMLIQNGVNMSQPNGQLAQDALDFYKVFASTDKIWDNTLPSSTIAFANGKTAMYFGPTWRAFEIQQINPDLRFRTVEIPQLPKENPTDPSISYATYWVEGVWARGTSKEEAWKFLKFLSSKEILEKLYNNASRVRNFGEPYPRVDMAELLLDHPIAGSVIRLAPEARSWYLATRTHDGDTGINSQMNKYFEDALNKSGARVSDSALSGLSKGITQVLSQYNLIKR